MYRYFYVKVQLVGQQGAPEKYHLVRGHVRTLNVKRPCLYFTKNFTYIYVVDRHFALSFLMLLHMQNKQIAKKHFHTSSIFLHCFDPVGWVSGRRGGIWPVIMLFLSTTNNDKATKAPSQVRAQ